MQDLPYFYPAFLYKSEFCRVFQNSIMGTVMYDSTYLFLGFFYMLGKYIGPKLFIPKSLNRSVLINLRLQHFGSDKTV